MPVIYLVGATNRLKRKENSKRRKFVKFNGVQIPLFFYAVCNACTSPRLVGLELGVGKKTSVS